MSAIAAVNRPTAAAVDIALANGQRAVAKFSKSRVWNKIQDCTDHLLNY